MKKLLLMMMMEVVAMSVMTGCSFSHSFSNSFANIVISDPNIIINVNLNGKSYKSFVSVKEYFKFKQKTHRVSHPTDFISFVTYDNETIRSKALYITRDLKTPEEKAQQLLDFVHCHMYDASNEKGIDYVKYPVETMVERGGDCEDLAILGAALMKSIGIDVILIDFPKHIGFAVSGNFSGANFDHNGKKYYYAEPTGTDWPIYPATHKIGYIPSKYHDVGVKIYEIK